MIKDKTVITATLSFIGGIVVNTLGGFDTVLITLLVTMGVDYVFGVLSALHKREYSWLTGALGISKKFALLVIVALGVTLDQGLGTENVIRLSILMFYIANELLSIIEHMVFLEIPVPSILEKVVQVFTEKSDEGDVK